MNLTLIDLVAFIGFLVFVVAVSLYASRRERNAEDYFLAGRSLSWWLVGISLIASNISTEHFVGMAGSAFGRVGLAIASYEWMASVTLVIVAWYLLPKFLAAGIYTMPEFLEYRYAGSTRAIMATFIMLAYVVVALATVLYSGALALVAIFDLPSVFQAKFGVDSVDEASRWALVSSIWFIGIVAAAYTVYGGLKAVVWSDLLQGGALLLGGVLVLLLGFSALGSDAGFFAGVSRFFSENESKLHTVLPWNDPEIPWLAVFVGGLWIPNLFYWGMNQFITQRTLAARSLAEGQKGILLAAFIKLAIPFIIVFPGIMAYQLYAGSIDNPDAAYPYLMTRLLPPQLRGVMLAALTGAVMSSFNSMLNSASTIFTMDIYARHFRKDATAVQKVSVGRWATAVFVVVACLWAPVISRFEGVFTYIQMVWGFISPGIVASFLFGLWSRRAPAAAANAAMLSGVPLYGFLLWQFPDVAFLHHMAITFALLITIMWVVTRLRPLDAPVSFPEAGVVDLTPAPGVRGLGVAVLVCVAALYLFFW